jgi:hypothetical protein
MSGWADLNHLQTGRCVEYFAKMALVRAGFLGRPSPARRAKSRRC